MINADKKKEMKKLERDVIGTAVDSITEEGVIIKRKDGSKEVIQGDDVIMSVGYLPSPLENSGKLPLVGDCKKVGNLRTVIWGAWDVAMNF